MWHICTAVEGKCLHGVDFLSVNNDQNPAVIQKSLKHSWVLIVGPLSPEMDYSILSNIISQGLFL